MELAHQIHQVHLHFQQNGELSTTEISEAFEHYFQARRTRTAVVQFLVPLVHKIGSVSSPQLVILRDGVFAMFPDTLKTIVFDFTHQWALGWTYTPPNLGQGLYHRLLGGEFMRSNLSLHKFHQHDTDRYCRGTVNVTHGPSVLATLLCFLMRLPRPMQNGEVELRVTTLPDGSEQWRRLFSSCDGLCSQFNTHQYCDEENLKEVFGPFIFYFEVVIVKENVFELNLEKMSVGWKHVSVPVPAVFLPKVRGTTTHDSNCTGWKYAVDIRGPVWSDAILGLIFKYEGVISAISAD